MLPSTGKLRVVTTSIIFNLCANLATEYRLVQSPMTLYLILASSLNWPGNLNL